MLDEMANAFLHRLRPPARIVNGSNGVVPNVQTRHTKLGIFPHMRRVSPDDLRFNGPKRPQIVHDLVEVVDIPDILLTSKFIPIFETRRGMSAIFAPVLLNDLPERARSAAFVDSPPCVRLFH